MTGNPKGVAAYYPFNGKGRLFILNVPENFAQLYQLPTEMWQAIAKHLTRGLTLYTAGEPNTTCSSMIIIYMDFTTIVLIRLRSKLL